MCGKLLTPGNSEGIIRTGIDSSGRMGRRANRRGEVAVSSADTVVRSALPGLRLIQGESIEIMDIETLYPL